MTQRLLLSAPAWGRVKVEQCWAEGLQHPVCSTALKCPQVSDSQLDPSPGTSRRGLKNGTDFFSPKLESLGISFLLQLQANNILRLVKNNNPKLLKYLGNTSYIVFFPKSL